MTATQWVEHRGRGFWAYDVGLGVLLKHVIDAAATQDHSSEPWLSEAVAWWRVVASVSDYGLAIQDNWTREQCATFVALVDVACTELAQRQVIPAGELQSWRLLDDRGIFPRGAHEVSTSPIVELGQAIQDLVAGRLSAPPDGEDWLFGTPEGRTTISRKAAP
jgi:hypothetical protein